MIMAMDLNEQEEELFKDWFWLVGQYKMLLIL